MKLLRRFLSMIIAPCAIIAPFLALLGMAALMVHNGEIAVLAFECSVGCAALAAICWQMEQLA